MKFVIIGIVAALTGAVISAVALTSRYGVLPTEGSVGSNERIAQLNDRVQRTEKVLQKISETLALIEQRSRLVDASEELVINKNLMDAAGSDVKTNTKQLRRGVISAADANVLVDKKTEEVLISRLSDSAYISSKTMAEFVGSEEMYHLPAASREKVMEEMMRKLNDGSINIEQFTKGMAPQK